MGDFKPDFEQVDDLNVGETVTIFFYETENVRADGINRHTQFIDRTSVAISVRGDSIMMLSAIIIGVCGLLAARWSYSLEKNKNKLLNIKFVRLNWIFAIWINTILLLTCFSANGQELSDGDGFNIRIGNFLPDSIPAIDSLKNSLSKPATCDSINAKTMERLCTVDTLKSEIHASALGIETQIENASVSEISIPGANLPHIGRPDLFPDNTVDVSGINTDLSVPDGLSLPVHDLRDALSETSSSASPTIAESNFGEITNTDVMSDQISQADKLRRYHDPDVAKEEAMNKIKIQAVNYFAGHDEELKSALDKFSEVKSKIPDPDGVIDMFGKNKSQSDSVSFSERLVPGVTLQLQRDDAFLIDLNPSVAIKIRHGWQLGIGWNHRWACRADDPLIRMNAQIFGLRSFTEFVLKKQLRLRAEFEYLKTASTMRPGSNESSEKQWVVNFNAGIKKSFSLSEKLSGNFQIMYNISEISHQHIYSNKLNARIGFDFDRIFTRSEKRIKTRSGL